MKIINLFFILWFIIFSIPALSFAQYLRSNLKNTKGAGLVVLLVIVAGYGVYQLK